MDGNPFLVREHVLLKGLTTFRVGGPARFFCEIYSIDDIARVLVYAEARGLPFRVLGGGSNVLVSDGGFSGLVMHMRMRGRTYTEDGAFVLARVAAGEEWDAFVADTVARGLWGLENLSLIPGTVGASPIQNVGAYGVEVADVLHAVEVFDTKTGAVHTMHPRECRLSYRDSIFKQDDGKHFVVTHVVFRLSKKPTPHVEYPDVVKELVGSTEPTLTDVRGAIIAIRSRKLPDPKQIGTAGSFFKNPIVGEAFHEELQERFPDMPFFSLAENTYKVPLAWVLDHVLHLNGIREGAVGLWPTQPLVVVQYGNATARDIEIFTTTIAEKVFAATRIHVEREVMRIA